MLNEKVHFCSFSHIFKIAILGHLQVEYENLIEATFSQGNGVYNVQS